MKRATRSGVDTTGAAAHSLARKRKIHIGRKQARVPVFAALMATLVTLVPGSHNMMDDLSPGCFSVTTTAYQGRQSCRTFRSPVHSPVILCNCSDLVPCTPPDFVACPDNFLPALHHPQLRDWALKVHALWVTLSRKVHLFMQHRPLVPRSVRTCGAQICPRHCHPSLHMPGCCINSG
jgi:hypothetical protein